MNDVLREILLVNLMIILAFLFVIAIDGPPKNSEFKEKDE
jgi:hypothetical protein